jgi:PAS domain S-box-containing protein
MPFLSAETYRTFLEDLTEWVCRFQPDGTILYVNPAYCHFFGKTEAELVGQRWQPVAFAEDIPHIEAQLQTLSPAQPVVVIENRVIGGDGATHWGQFINRAVYDPDGVLVTMQSVGRDITERKHHELQIQLLVQEQRAILDSPLIGIVKVSRRAIVWANAAFAAMLDYTVDELLGQPTRPFYLNDSDYDRVGRESFPVLVGGGTYRAELQQRGKHGAVGWYEFSMRMLDVSTATLIGTMVNITPRKRAEADMALYREQLESKVAQRTAELSQARDAADSAKEQAEQAYAAADASRASLRAAIDAMGDAVVISDLDGRFIQINAAFASFHRFASMEECARTLQEYPAFIDVYASDGELLPLERWAVPRALQGETAVNLVFTLRRRDTGDTWVGSYNFAPVRDAQGGIIGSVVTARDITAQRNVEIRLQQAHDAAQAGLQAKSTFLATMSHELRTPMNAIVGMGQLMHRQATDPRQRRQLDVVLAASTKLLSLIESLLDLARIQSGSWVREDHPFALGGLMTQVLALGRARLDTEPERMVLALDESLNTLRLVGDAGRLTQVLLNLVDNAIKFAAQGQIRLRCERLAETPGRVTLRFEVQDEGPGIPVADQTRIFLLEQGDGSATRRHGGSGLGLALSKGLVERLGGSIGVDSTPGTGSVFWFTLHFPHAGDLHDTAAPRPTDTPSS